MKTPPVFPLKIPGIPSTVLYEFIRSEQPAHEDARQRRDNFKPKAEELTAYEILTRHKTVIEVRNAAEADKIYYAACSGTFQLIDDDRPMAWNRWARRISDILRPHAQPDTVRRFPSADGY